MTRLRVLAAALVILTSLAVGTRAWRQPFEGRPPSLVLAALDANRDGAIGGPEIEGAPDALRALDRDGDQRLTAAELGPMGGPPRPGAAPSGGGTPDDVVDLVMGFDRDGDSRVSAKELPERFAGLLARSDADGDGQLTRAELTATAAATPTTGEGGGRGPGGGDPLLRALDVDRDGTLGPEEIAAAANALRTLDRDGDGQVSGAELRPARGRGGRGGPRGDHH